MKKEIEFIVEHYEKTYEITLKVWEQRNRTFLILLIVVGVATLITFNVSEAQPLLADLIAKFLAIKEGARIAALRTSLPYGLIQSIFLMVILYLMVIVYHRTTFILRNYMYLEAVENEIRAGLELSDNSIAFSREGRFYKEHTPYLSKLVGLSYIVMLGVLLSVFSGMRILTDLTSGNIWFTVVDVFLALSALIFFIAYAQASSSIVKSLTKRFSGRKKTCR
jgi:hypothetical protein